MADVGEVKAQVLPDTHQNCYGWGSVGGLVAYLRLGWFSFFPSFGIHPIVPYQTRDRIPNLRSMAPATRRATVNPVVEDHPEGAGPEHEVAQPEVTELRTVNVTESTSRGAFPPEQKLKILKTFSGGEPGATVDVDPRASSGRSAETTRHTCWRSLPGSCPDRRSAWSPGRPASTRTAGRR